MITEEHRRKLSLSHMGQKGYWTGKKFGKDHLKKLSQAKKGKHLSPSTEFKKGQVSWNKGKVGITSKEINGMWKGDKVGYYALHAWIKRNFGKPKECQVCGSEKNIQWSNKDHKYTRNRTDWYTMCVPCHRQYDYSLRSFTQ